MADGAVVFITDSIEAGDSTSPFVDRNGPDCHEPCTGFREPVRFMGCTWNPGQQGNDRRTTEPVVRLIETLRS